MWSSRWSSQASATWAGVASWAAATRCNVPDKRCAPRGVLEAPPRDDAGLDGLVGDEGNVHTPAGLEHAVLFGLAVQEAVVDLVGGKRDAIAARTSAARRICAGSQLLIPTARILPSSTAFAIGFIQAVTPRSE